jgi:hypothetical protein
MRSDRRKKYEKEYLELNKERKKAYRKQWYENNKDKKLLKSKINYNKNKGKRKEQTAKWLKNNPLVTYVNNAKRRAKKLNATPCWLTDFDLQYIKSIYAQAKWLSQNDGTKYHVDHIYPLQGKEICGLHVPTNLQIIPAVENIRKFNKIPVN